MKENFCPFCNPAVLKSTFAESENFRAVYNLAPVLPGHILIVPKKHLSKFLEIDEALIAEMVSFSRKIIKVIAKAFKTDSFDWTIQDGKPAGQTVEHMHMHIIPRHENDLPDPGDWYPMLKKKTEAFIDSTNRNKLSEEEIVNICQNLKKNYRELF
ncbi:MAG: HIT family protein [Bacteroidales bacterium]|nr:HIT family protein [Bacteroidales bacterium]MBN2818396.1 HIT family protein [Bacteroidales bacterium]